jgi:RNA recognition motif-containing protein
MFVTIDYLEASICIHGYGESTQSVVITMEEVKPVGTTISNKHNEVTEYQVNNDGEPTDMSDANGTIFNQIVELRHQPQSTINETPYSSTTVYMSGIPIRYCTESVIEKIMSPYGKIVRCTIHTQQSKIFAFCDYEDPISATTAIRAVNGRKLGGQSLMVRPAYKEQSSNHYSASSRPIDNHNNNSNSNSNNNPKRQRQQLDSKIDAIKRKLAKHTT